jgi:exodeoxyribonuclease VII small subunit
MKDRLDQILEAVDGDELPLDEALSLYEEAVGIGLAVTSVLEQETDESAFEDGAGEPSPAQS